MNKMKKYFSVKRPMYKTWWIYPAALLLFFILVVVIPIIINEAYKVKAGYLTMWDAADVLSFYSVVLSGLITICALIITIYHSKKDTERQLVFQRSQVKAPFFIIKSVGEKSGREAELLGNNTWKIKNKLENAVSYNKTDAGSQSQFEITLENIGDGIAILPRISVGDKSNEASNNDIII